MTRRRLRTAVAAAGVCLVAGCGGSSHAGSGAAPASAGSRATLSAAGPSVSSRMICSDEIQTVVTLVLGLDGHPKTTSGWVKPVYSCTYRLHEGPFNLSVTEFPSDKAALASFNQTKSRYAQGQTPIQTLDALGVPSFLAADDVLISLKTNHLLRVDATQLPKIVGPLHRSRRDLSYLVASSILKCWSGA